MTIGSSAIAAGPAAAPARRLLAAFCMLASDLWLASDKVRCEIHGGRFEPHELDRFPSTAPALRAGCLAADRIADDGGGAVRLDFRLAAVAIGRRTAEGEPDGAQAARIGSRVAFELARRQEGEDGVLLWPQACFSAAELDPAVAGFSRGNDIGEPREIRAANLYSPRPDGKGFAFWAVTWMQEFRARSGDFDIELPEPAGIPAELLSARAPEIGIPHRDDYDRIYPEARA
ncbi:MAG: hypothetical protein OXN96_19025 [Bryobacterales bacterium]|nr:hypothetical protein [Bryobacterales bacterium]